MFSLGNVYIGKYKVWVTTPVFSVHPWDTKAQNLPYFEVLVSREICEKPEKIYATVDLSAAEEFKGILSLDPQKRATGATDLISFQTYLERKSSEAPMWKLSRSNVEKLLEICLNAQQTAG